MPSIKDKRTIRLEIPDRAIRGLSRKQYKAVSHWLRLTARNLKEGMNWVEIDKMGIDALMYGEGQSDAVN